MVSWETLQTDHPACQDAVCHHLWLCVSGSSCLILRVQNKPRVLFIPHHRVLCFGERFNELSSVSTWGPTVIHISDLPLLLGRHRPILKLLLHCSAWGAAGIFSPCASGALPHVVHNASQPELAHSYPPCESTLDMHLKGQFLTRIPIVSLVSVY